ncbi:MAG TPA: hypothetical protein VM096_14710 [Vicinamibacterales bacterium]|nr:hypothetical protein [Vicinamibacterales bacterium]
MVTLWLAFVAALGVIAYLSPEPDRVTDRPVYEATAQQFVVPDCADLHCFRVLMPWLLGSLPGPSLPKWKVYAVVANATAAIVVLALSIAWALPARAAIMAAAMSAFGFGALYTLHDVFTSDPLMFALGPLLVLLLLRERFMLAAGIASVGVLAKEFAAAPVYIFSAASILQRRFPTAWRALAAANCALIVWLLLQFTLMLRFNYGYGDNPSTHLGSGGYLAKWLAEQSPRGAAIAMFNEFGVLWLLAPIGWFLATRSLRMFAIASIPVALVFGYVQQPDRALWNFHFLVTPLASLVLSRLPAIAAWAMIAFFAIANLRVGAQLMFVPAARGALAASIVIAAIGIMWAWRNGHFAVAQPA